MFSDAERVALDFALEAASTPNGDTDESYAALAEHWSAEEIVEILGVVCMFGAATAGTHDGNPARGGRDRRAGELIGDSGWDVGTHAPVL